MKPAPSKTELSLFENFSKHRSRRGHEVFKFLRVLNPAFRFEMSLVTSAAAGFQSRVTKAALLLFSIAVLLAGGAAAVRAQSVVDGFDPNANDRVNVVVVQPDGKILIGGRFTTLSPNGGAPVTRNRIARLNLDGTLDTAFNPNADETIYAIAVQADGKILVGGYFTSIGGQPRNYIARLDATNGLADSFNPNADITVFSIAVQSGGKILAAGGFTTIGGQTRNYIARLDAMTGLADSFNPSPDSDVASIAVQADGKILAAGYFTSIGGQPRNRIARLDATNGLADSFNPDANAQVTSFVVQTDGKILVTGGFNGANSIGGQARDYIARLDGATGLADSFNPSPDDFVTSIALQADGKVLAGGVFGSIGGQTRNRIARLDGVTGLADSLDPNVPDPEHIIRAIAVQADGKIVVGGSFSGVNSIGGQTRNNIARFAPPPSPLLTIQRGPPTNVVLSWATNFTGFMLENSTNFNPDTWSAVTNPPVVSGTNNVVTNDASGPMRHYRLRKY